MADFVVTFGDGAGTEVTGFGLFPEVGRSTLQEINNGQVALIKLMYKAAQGAAFYFILSIFRLK